MRVNTEARELEQVRAGLAEIAEPAGEPYDDDSDQDQEDVDQDHEGCDDDA